MLIPTTFVHPFGRKLANSDRFGESLEWWRTKLGKLDEVHVIFCALVVGDGVPRLLRMPDRRLWSLNSAMIALANGVHSKVQDERSS